MLLKSLDFFGRTSGPAQELAVLLARSNDFGDGFLQFGMVLLSAQAERKGKMAF